MGRVRAAGAVPMPGPWFCLRCGRAGMCNTMSKGSEPGQPVGAAGGKGGRKEGLWARRTAHAGGGLPVRSAG